MKVSISWLKELVDLNCSVEELAKLLPLRSISTKEVTNDFIELDMKGYNRADLLSMRGVAMEVAAITGSKILFKEPEEANFVWNQAKLPSVNVKIENTNLCPIYCVVKIEGLILGSSPEPLVKKLNDSGVRSVNNIADITNLIMLEYGQPLHSFDASKVEGDRIIVKTGKDGEEFVALDGKKRKLTSSDLLICDNVKPIGIAGVMGAQNSEVTNSTTAILLEAAIFDPIQIRKTATRLGLQSEAAKRFQHGLTKKRLLQALNSAIKMYQELGGKLTAINLVGDFEDKVRKITLTKTKLENLVGVKFEVQQVEEYLEKLGFTLATQGYTLSGWEVTVPYWRLDVTIEADLIEEVARMYGYEKIPAEKVSESKPLQKEDPIFQKIFDLRQKLVDLGLTEIQTYSFYSTNVQNALGFNDLNKNSIVRLENPMSAETEYLRQNIWPNLLEVVNRNLRKGYKDIAIFEIGKVFNVGKDGNPVENYRLAIALCNGTDNPLEELYQIIQNSRLHPKGVNLKQTNPPGVTNHLFHPKRFVALEKDGSPRFAGEAGKQIGGLAEVHLRVLNKLGIEKRVAILEMELQ